MDRGDSGVRRRRLGVGHAAAGVFRDIQRSEPVAAERPKRGWGMKRVGGGMLGRWGRTAASPLSASCCRFCFREISDAHAYLLFLAALAAANADTWGTEIGSALRGQPYDLRTETTRTARGTSGAVSLGGTVAALAGAALIGVFAPDWAARMPS